MCGQDSEANAFLLRKSPRVPLIIRFAPATEREMLSIYPKTSLTVAMVTCYCLHHCGVGHVEIILSHLN